MSGPGLAEGFFRVSGFLPRFMSFFGLCFFDNGRVASALAMPGLCVTVVDGAS